MYAQQDLAIEMEAVLDEELAIEGLSIQSQEIAEMISEQSGVVDMISEKSKCSTVYFYTLGGQRERRAWVLVVC